MESHEQPDPGNLMGNYQMPSSLQKDLDEEGTQLIRVLTDHTSFLNIIRREMRGEQLYGDNEGNQYWMQIDKPMFVKLDEKDKPIMVKNERGQMEYVCNDDAINAVINTLKSAGLNPVSPLTTIDENIIRADLLEIQSKVVTLLAAKRKKWGIDKAEYPLMVSRINTLIQDARYRAKDGIALKAIRTITSRIEQSKSSGMDRPPQGMIA